MPVSEATLREAEETWRKMERDKAASDKRAEVCGCGHPVAKHMEQGGCLVHYGHCPCKLTLPVLKVPNARLFMYKTDAGGHAVVKGMAKTIVVGSGHRLEWVARCSECGGEPETVVALEGGQVNVPRCGEHR